MELIYEKKKNGVLVDAGFLTKYQGDFDITTDKNSPTNDFTIVQSLPNNGEDLLFKEGEIETTVYVDGTEWGGKITGVKPIDVSDNTVTYYGKTWRGMLMGDIIEPPAGQDYKVVSGNVATILRGLPMRSIFNVLDTAYTSNTFQFNRYISTFEGMDDLLRFVQSNLRSKLVYNEGIIDLSVIEARDRTDLIEVSQDYNDKVQMSITYDGDTPRRLICLGKGELKDREVVNFYADENWNITTTPIAGAYPTQVYDYSGSEDLSYDGRKKFQEIINNHRQFDIGISGIDVQLSDIIGAKDYLTGQVVTAEISGIIWRVSNFGTYQEEDFQYKTKVRT